ncbi:MAG: ATP-grasp domain-containing protein [Xenococcus sp. MO_188.B8]|nr:ATP-grasp domain-containing protein [Xenococcus sp. MO_188.B8]
MEEVNILFTSAGRRVELLNSFRQSLNNLNLKGKIIVADCNHYIPTAVIADVYEPVSRVSDPNYINRLQEICQRHHIKLLIPLIDTELYKLSLHRQNFAELGVTILVSSPETNEICLDKGKTSSFFQQLGVPTPAILDPETILANHKSQYPCLIKPANGSSSIGVTIINNAKELAFFKDYIDNAIVQELLTGQEYTLDILIDFAGGVRCVVPRLRIETRAGEISKGITVKNWELMTAGKTIAEALPGAIGCINIQCFQLPNNEIIFIEINPRFGGGIPLSIKAGANYPEWILQMLLQQDLSIKIDDWQEGMIMLRHDESIFIESNLIK